MRRMLCVVVLSLGWLVGCGNDDKTASAPPESTTSTHRAAATTAAPTGGVLGTWETDLPESVEENGIPPAGRWMLSITTAGVKPTPPPGHRWPLEPLLESGPLTSDSGVMRIGPEQSDEPCERSPEADDFANGTYRWRVSDETLTFEVIDDGCLDRVLVLTTSPWRRVSS